MSIHTNGSIQIVFSEPGKFLGVNGDSVVVFGFSFAWRCIFVCINTHIVKKKVMRMETDQNVIIIYLTIYSAQSIMDSQQ
jgi:hypothetical protein